MDEPPDILIKWHAPHEYGIRFKAHQEMWIYSKQNKTKEKSASEKQIKYKKN